MTRSKGEARFAKHDALDLLDDYDHQRVGLPAATSKAVYMMSYEEASRLVDRLRGRFGESSLFGVEKDKGLEVALGAVVQTAGGADVCRAFPFVDRKL